MKILGICRSRNSKELPGFKLVRDVLFDIFRRAGIFVKKEAPVNFLTDPQEGRSTLWPTDVLVHGWVGGRHVSVDLTGVSPLVRLGTEDFTVVKSLPAKWQNTRNRALTINMFLSHLHSTFLAS
ncbi:auxilin-like protein [Trifolium pratense]|uniref:Auxilin-like protein n=1 Tax=Trifolium pratense TaxID=57577 RepID=A0A2K3KP48_TRIPR|nr:auxilin-like protein [Trifolium pratense]